MGQAMTWDKSLSRPLHGRLGKGDGNCFYKADWQLLPSVRWYVTSIRETIDSILQAYFQKVSIFLGGNSGAKGEYRRDLH
jgi:hypothetical protein